MVVLVMLLVAPVKSTVPELDIVPFPVMFPFIERVLVVL
jgi:hypothetical protein